MSSCFRLGKSQLENRFWNALLMALEAGNYFLIAPFIFLDVPSVILLKNRLIPGLF
jgi:hypothetical protein